jgi:transcriptional regulator with XRE-family HTH domain
MAEKHEDPAMVKVRTLFEKSGMSLHDLGLKMGYTEGIARQSVFQFMKTGDPRISMLRRFADALGIPLEKLTISTTTKGKPMSVNVKEYRQRKAIFDEEEKKRKGKATQDNDAFNNTVAAWVRLTGEEQRQLYLQNMAPAQNQPEFTEAQR